MHCHSHSLIRYPWFQIQDRRRGPREVCEVCGSGVLTLVSVEAGDSLISEPELELAMAEESNIGMDGRAGRYFCTTHGFLVR